MEIIVLSSAIESCEDRWKLSSDLFGPHRTEHFKSSMISLSPLENTETVFFKIIINKTNSLPGSFKNEIKQNNKINFGKQTFNIFFHWNQFLNLYIFVKITIKFLIFLQSVITSGGQEIEFHEIEIIILLKWSGYRKGPRGPRG